MKQSLDYTTTTKKKDAKVQRKKVCESVRKFYKHSSNSQSSKWKFEFTGPNQILELIVYTVEFVYNEVQGTLDLSSL